MRLDFCIWAVALRQLKTVLLRTGGGIMLLQIGLLNACGGGSVNEHSASFGFLMGIERAPDDERSLCMSRQRRQLLNSAVPDSQGVKSHLKRLGPTDSIFTVESEDSGIGNKL